MRSPHVPGARVRWRRFRALSALVVTTLAAPLGLATTLATTAAPAAAAPADGLPLVVSGDVVTRNLVAPASPNWTWASSDYSELRSLFAAYNSGGVTFDTTSVPSIASPTYDKDTKTGSLADVDVYVSGGVGGGIDGPDAGSAVDYGETGYTAEEERALLAWVQDGGVLIAQTNSKAFDNTRFLGNNPDGGEFVDVQEPAAYFDTVSGAHGCNDMPGNDGCAGAQDQAAPVGSVVNASTAIGAGVGTIRNWHTVTYFLPNTLPDNAQTVATLSYTCPSTSAVYCTDSTTTPTYNNNIGTDGIVVAYMPFNTAQFGKGAVVFTSDVDTFSNHYPEGAGTLTGGNRTLAQNTIAWIAQNRAAALPTDSGFTPMTPTRVYDTRTGIGTAIGKVPGGQFRDVQITGGSIPDGATAVAINLTATNQSGAGFLTVTPGGGAKSNTSNLNIPPGLIDVANAAVVGLSDGKIRVYNENNPTDVIVDVVGYWAPGTGSSLNATDPTRVFDTRGGTKVGPGQTRKVQITGTYPNGVTIPGSATGVVMNVTATNGTTGGFLTVHDTPTVPNASNVNFRANTNVPNLVFAKLAGDGSVYVTNALGNTDVIFDVNGYFSGSGSEMTTVGPGRIFDTRVPIGQLLAGKVASNGNVTLGINGAAGFLPTDGVGAVLVNITVDQPDAAGFLTAYPPALVPPDASNVNFAPGQTVANLALAKVSSDGQLRIANTSPGASNVIVDAFAWFG